jgi:hypothetical protein
MPTISIMRDAQAVAPAPSPPILSYADASLDAPLWWLTDISVVLLAALDFVAGCYLAVFAAARMAPEMLAVPLFIGGAGLMLIISSLFTLRRGPRAWTVAVVALRWAVVPLAGMAALLLGWVSMAFFSDTDERGFAMVFAIIFGAPLVACLLFTAGEYVLLHNPRVRRAFGREAATLHWVRRTIGTLGVYCAIGAGILAAVVGVTVAYPSFF